MSDEDGRLLGIALEELARRPGSRRQGRSGRREPPAPGGTGAGGAGRKRMFMAGRLGPEASRVRYGRSTSSPVEGPWDLALVVRPR